MPQDANDDPALTGVLRDIFGGSPLTRVPVDAVWCDRAAIEEFSGDRVLSLSGGQGETPLGDGVHVPAGSTTVLFGPPGTSKTAAVVVPAILAAQGAVVVDAKPELHDMTSGHRATLGPVVSLRRPPGGPASDAVGPLPGDRINPLSSAFLPDDPVAFVEYLDLLVRVLLPTADSGADSYFIDKGRAALTGLLHAYLAENRPRPSSTARGHDLASLPNFRTWFLQVFATVPACELAGDSSDGRLASLVHRVDPGSHGPVPGTSSRAHAELSSLLSMHPEERAPILATVGQALLSLADPRLADVLSSSTFSPLDLRGTRGADGSWRPTTLYVESPHRRDPWALLAALAVETVAFHLLRAPPASGRDHVGPHGVAFILDEFLAIRPVEAVDSILARGAPSQVSQLLVCASPSRLVHSLGSGSSESLLRGAGVLSFVVPGGRDVVGQVLSMATPPASTTDPVGRPDGEGPHLVTLVRGFHRRPLLTSPLPFYRYPLLARLVRSRGHGPLPAPLVRDHRPVEDRVAGARPVPTDAAVGPSDVKDLRRRVAALVGEHGGSRVADALGWFGRGSVAGGDAPSTPPTGLREELSALLVEHGWSGISSALAWVTGGDGPRLAA